MGVKVIKKEGKTTIEVGGAKKDVTYSYDKIVTPDTKRGAGEEKGEFPTLAEFAQFLGGKVEFKVDADGNSDGPCLVGYAIDGWNTAQNILARNKAIMTEDVAVEKINAEIKALAEKLGMDPAKLRAMALGA